MIGLSLRVNRAAAKAGLAPGELRRVLQIALTADGALDVQRFLSASESIGLTTDAALIVLRELAGSPSFSLTTSGVLDAATFDPLSLFASGEEGAWYEPSTTTAFLSTTDLTPCGYGDGAGFLLDKSKGAGYADGSFTGLGSEENGNPGDPFTTVTPYRSVYPSGTGPTLSGDVLVAANSPTYAVIGTNISVTPGKTYILEADAVISIAGGYFRILDGTVSGSTELANVASNPGVRQTYSAIVTPTVSTIHALVFTYGSAVNPAVTLYSLSVLELPGNHATQVTAGARPILARVPPRGRVNELSETDTLATQSVTVTAEQRTLSFKGTGTVTLSGASTAGPLVGTGAEDRVSLTFTPSSGTLTLTVLGAVTDAQLETGSTATAYQKVVDEYDVTEAGVTSLEYLFDDEADDVLPWTAPTDTDYTVAYVNTSGTASILTAQSLSGATDILLDPALVGYVAVDRALTSQETTDLTAYLEALA